MNFGVYVARSALHWPDKAAVRFRDEVLTYRQLEEQSNRLAHALQTLGLQRGDRVAIIAPNRPDIVVAECAFYKLGLVKVALNSRLSPQELEDALGNAEPLACLVAPTHRAMVQTMRERLPSLRHLMAWDCTEADRAAGWLDAAALMAQAPSTHIHIDLSPDDLAVLHYTSGSTGKLKAAMQTMGNRMTSLRKVIMGRMQSNGDDVMLLVGPITHASGMFIQALLYQGVTILLLDRFHPAELLQCIEKHRVSMTFMVPAMIHALLAEPSIKTRDLSSLRLLSYGAAPMSPARIREAWAAFGPVLAQGYGAGETTGGVISLSIADHARAIHGDQPELLSSCGRATCESEVLVLDEQGQPVQGDAIGEICVRGPDVFAGYWHAPELSQAAIDAQGWLRTGDLARIDAQGYIYIVDRKKEMLVSGGFNVYPSEIEAVLAQHPAVYEVCVVGVPDDHWGEVVKAVVVLRQDAETSEQEVVDFCKGRLADFKKPRSVDFVAELPKNSNGKLSRKDVRERYWQGRDRKVN
ncbi:MAG: AMP-binding protein [Pseudomonadota bacterium]|jgi:acyl-CoA synthetase (AMP-forming)/AMP-acid ligase II